MARDWPGRVRLVLAFLLVTSPFWLMPHAGETTHVYEAEKIDYTEGPTGYIRAMGPIDGLDCYEFGTTESPCSFAAHVVQNGPVTVNRTSHVFGDLSPGTKYVVVGTGGDGKPFYRWQVNRTDTEDDTEYRLNYSLKPVGPETILQDIAVTENALSSKARETLDSETVETHGEELEEAGTVVKSDGEYYLVTEKGSRSPDWSPVEANAIRGLAFVVGLILFRWY